MLHIACLTRASIVIHASVAHIVRDLAASDRTQLPRLNVLPIKAYRLDKTVPVATVCDMRRCSFLTRSIRVAREALADVYSSTEAIRAERYIGATLTRLACVVHAVVCVGWQP